MNDEIMIFKHSYSTEGPNDGCTKKSDNDSQNASTQGPSKQLKMGLDTEGF